MAEAKRTRRLNLKAVITLAGCSWALIAALAVAWYVIG